MEPMRLYPKVIPAISSDVIRTLIQDEDVEIEAERIADAELDVAAIMKEYLAADERVNAATRETLERRGLDQSRFDHVKHELAAVRGVRRGAGGRGGPGCPVGGGPTREGPKVRWGEERFWVGVGSAAAPPDRPIVPPEREE